MLLILITFLLNCLLSYSQVNPSAIDSFEVGLKKAKSDKQRFEVYRSLADNFSQINSDSGRYYITKFLALATQKELKKEILYAYQFIGSSYLNDQNFQKALEFYLNAEGRNRPEKREETGEVQLFFRWDFAFGSGGFYWSKILFGRKCASRSHLEASQKRRASRQYLCDRQRFTIYQSDEIV